MRFTLSPELTSGILLISLLLSFVVAVFLFTLLISTKRRKLITVTITQFLSLIVVFIGVIFTIISGNIIPLVATLLLENVLLIPHYLGMKNHKEKKQKVEVVEPVIIPEEVVVEDAE